jgi:hypothetical protein
MTIENPERLRAAGPIDPDNGFPLWFEDKKGVRLELGINRDRLNPDPLIPAIGELKDPANDLKFPDNFPDESFYFLAEAELQVGENGRAGRARVILALEAAFGGTGAPREGLNVVFARIRVRMDDLIPGLEYKVIHPYGEIDGELMKADDRGRVFYTQDLGIVEGDGTAVLRSGQVAPFLLGTTAVPDGYIGDGVTPQQVTGSPFINQNFVKIEWSPINPITNLPEPKQVTTDLFTVQGRRAKRVGAWLDSATYAGSIGNYELTIQARSDAGQDLRLVGTGVHFKLDSEGEFYTGLAQVASLPTDARLINVSDRPPTSYPIKDFTDRVIVESVIYDRTAKTLTIKARSSDPSAVLTLPQFNDRVLTPNLDSFPAGVAVPAEITVKSDKKGEGQQWVEVTGTTFSTNKSIEAIVAPLTAAAFAEEEVKLDGSVSLGATSFTWTQTAGINVTLTGANTDKVTFTPPAAGDYTFNLKVDGGGVSATVTQTITVEPKPQPDELKIDRGEYRRASRLFRIDGTLNPDRVPKLPNIVTVKFFDGKEELAIPDINGDWSVRRELLESEVNNLAPVRGVSDTIEFRSKRGKGTFTLFIRN